MKCDVHQDRIATSRVQWRPTGADSRVTCTNFWCSECVSASRTHPIVTLIGVDAISPDLAEGSYVDGSGKTVIGKVTDSGFQ